MNWARSGSPGNRTVSAKSPGWALMCLVAMVRARVSDSTRDAPDHCIGRATASHILAFLDSAGADRLYSPPPVARHPRATTQPTYRGDSLGSENRFVSAVGARLRPEACSR